MSMFHELMMRKKGMPSRYQEVEYLESTGTQYIDTGIAPKDSIGAYAKFYLNSNSTYSNYVLGSREASALRFYLYNNEQSVVKYGWLNLINTGKTPIKSQIVEAKLNFLNSRKYEYNNEIISSNLTTFTSGSTKNLFLFNANLGGSISSTSGLQGRIYNCQITDGTTLVRNYIPVYDTLTNKYGMWESVQGKFCGNDGTGDFTGA